MASLKLYFFGAPRIERDGRSLEPDTRKAIALLAYLTLTGEPQTRDALAAFLWPDFDESRAKAALRRTLSALKRRIGDEALNISRDMLGLQNDQIWCDVLQFQQLLAGTSDVALLETAISLYRDHFLAGFSLRDSLPFDEWQLQYAEQLRRELSRALEQLIRHYQTQQQFEKAIDQAHRWLQLDPLREEAHRQLMQLYARSGQRSTALQQYRDCVRVLEEELGVPPLAQTTQLYQDIQENRLDPPILASPPPAPLQTLPPAPTIPLVGRQNELQTLHQWYKQVGPDGRVLAITGEIGIGKTRLAEQFQSELSQAPVLQARCYEGEMRLAYAPFIQAIRERLHQPQAPKKLQDINPLWLAETARLLPELVEWFPQMPTAPSLDWPGAPGRFLEGLSQVLLALLDGQAPGLLWLDDVQWADTASLDLLAFLARRWRERPYLILVCWREGDLPADHRLHHLLTEARRENVGTEIRLSRLDKIEVNELVAATAKINPPSPTWTNRLYQESEGLPFLVTAYLEAHLVTNHPATDQWDLPSTARDLFLSRLTRTSETARQLLQTAAVIGRAFDFDLLQTTSGRSEEESLLALEELIAQFFLNEQSGEAAYDYHHHKLRELIYNEMSLVRRRLLHRRVAQALAARHRSETAVAAQIAAHYEQAGLEAEAAHAYQQAGDYARSLFAHREALSHYQSALALGHPQTADLHQACGDSHVRLGEYSAALTSYERAAALSERQQLPHLEHKIGQVHYRRGQWGLAERHFEQAAAQWSTILEDTETAEVASDLARLYIDWSTTAYRAGDSEQAQAYAHQAQTYAHEPLARAYVQNILGILARHQGDMAMATEQFKQSLDLAKRENLLAVQIAALNNLALVEATLHQPQAAHDRLQSALHLCLTYGDRHWEAALRNNLADRLHQLGDKEAAMTQLKQAVAIYAEIGQETGEWQPEIWKLTEW